MNCEIIFKLMGYVLILVKKIVWLYILLNNIFYNIIKIKVYLLYYVIDYY